MSEAQCASVDELEAVMNKNTKPIKSESDTRLGRKCLWIWIALQMLVLIVLVFHKNLEFISNFVGGFFPSVSKLNAKGAQEIAAVYFSVCVLVAPLLLVYLVWNENALIRMQETAKRNSRSATKTIFIILLGFPFLLGVIALVYFAPFEITESPRLSGQLALHFMINTKLGLLLLGPLFAFGLVLNTSLIYFLSSLPFLYLFKIIKE